MSRVQLCNRGRQPGVVGWSLGAIVIAAACLPAPAFGFRDFEARYETEARDEITMAAGPVLTCTPSPGAECVDARHGTGARLNNQDHIMQYIGNTSMSTAMARPSTPRRRPSSCLRARRSYTPRFTGAGLQSTHRPRARRSRPPKAGRGSARETEFAHLHPDHGDPPRLHIQRQLAVGSPSGLRRRDEPRPGWRNRPLYGSPRRLGWNFAAIPPEPARSARIAPSRPATRIAQPRRPVVAPSGH